MRLATRQETCQPCRRDLRCGGGHRPGRQPVIQTGASAALQIDDAELHLRPAQDKARPVPMSDMDKVLIGFFVSFAAPIVFIIAAALLGF